MAVIAVTTAGGSVVYIIASVGRCGGHSLTETTCARTHFPVLKALLLLIFTPLNTIIVNFAQPLLLLFFCLFWISLAALAAVLLIHVEITVSLLYHPWTIGPQVRTLHGWVGCHAFAQSTGFRAKRFFNRTHSLCILRALHI